MSTALSADKRSLVMLIKSITESEFALAVLYLFNFIYNKNIFGDYVHYYL